MEHQTYLLIGENCAVMTASVMKQNEGCRKSLAVSVQAGLFRKRKIGMFL
jgi:hypothetical protein